MRWLLALAALAVASCDDVPLQGTQEVPPELAFATFEGGVRYLGEGVILLAAVSEAVKPVAVDACRTRNPQAPAAYCDFQILWLQDAPPIPNAFQTIGPDGRPLIIFTPAMLAIARNAQELAFIVGHEAGHQIANHILLSDQQARANQLELQRIAAAEGATNAEIRDAGLIGADIGFRAFSQERELEADRIGTYIALRAGFDPVEGARSFQRFRGSGSPFSTHPPGARRFQEVQRTFARIQRGEQLPELRPATQP